MSDLPRFWNFVHRDDERFGKRPRNPRPPFMEWMCYAGAIIMIAVAIVVPIIVGHYNFGALISVSMFSAVYVGIGLWHRRKRLREVAAATRFYQARP